MTVPTSSSATTGFFQLLPNVRPAYTSPENLSSTAVSDDAILPHLLTLYLPTPIPSSITTELHAISRLALSPITLCHGNIADHQSPTLQSFTTFGQHNNTPSQLHLSSSWSYLCDKQTTLGIIAHGYPQPEIGAHRVFPTVTWNRRVSQFLLNHVWDPSSAGVTCPAAMTDGAAVLLRQQLSDPEFATGSSTRPGDWDAKRRYVFSEAYSRLTSLDPARAWRAGQWMTERSGGSDVRGTETVARRVEQEEELRGCVDAVGLPLGDWVVNGFKWFSSGTDAHCAVLLAKTAGGKLSCFFAPVHRRDEAGENGQGGLVMNGVRISRLKNKLGTRALPTAELELEGMRAWLVGKEGEGVKVISSLLNISRLHTAKGSMGCWGRGLAISRAWTRCRTVKNPNGGKILLSENRQHVRWLAEETVKYRAYTALYIFGVALLGAGEMDSVSGTTHAEVLGLIPKHKATAVALLRMLTPVMKQTCSVAAVQGLRECMESMGGVGYCENVEDHGVLNVAKLFRDANVNPIWEGTTSVLAEDLLRALKVGNARAGKTLDELVGVWLKSVLNEQRIPRLFTKEVRTIEAIYDKLLKLVSTKSEQELLWKGRIVLRLFADLFCSVLLIADALVDRDDVAMAVARRWAAMIKEDDDETADWEAEADMDRRIFLNERHPGQPGSSKGQSRL